MTFAGFVVIFSGLLTLMSNRKHVLNMLLSLEFVILGLVWMMIFFLVLFSSYYVLLYFFVLCCMWGGFGSKIGCGIDPYLWKWFTFKFDLVQC